ncbi:peptide deformylase [Candidatus Berkiella aquae]|uniref:Peptide deformylase n=1 Tax=Candidatus Berkiella aquae TaxID=295108 RepID=A0A0Q9YWB4_9GAMM|nr:peptide deformylase [Candidatus Berkiella aquae]MCS5709812.1 peptide deformylase [Candidatus Berkiella aquae]
MTLKIYHYPHKVLREVTPVITVFDDKLETTTKQMIETMYAGDGCGLAAPQVGLSLRLFVMDISKEANQPQCFINPEILESEGAIAREEGCLSLPGVYAKIERAAKITVRYQDVKGQSHTISVDGIAAHCIQHELDHLNGVLNIDRLSKLKRALLLKKLEKVQKATS